MNNYIVHDLMTMNNYIVHDLMLPFFFPVVDRKSTLIWLSLREQTKYLFRPLTLR